MELFIVGMYCIGILAMIAFMANIKRLADILFPIDRPAEVRRTVRKSAPEAAREIARWNPPRHEERRAA